MREGKKQPSGEGASQEAGLPSGFKEQSLSIVGVKPQAMLKGVSIQGGSAPPKRARHQADAKGGKGNWVAEPIPPAAGMESGNKTPKEGEPYGRGCHCL